MIWQYITVRQWEYINTYEVVRESRPFHILDPIIETITSSDDKRWIIEFTATKWYLNELYKLHKIMGSVISSNF